MTTLLDLPPFAPRNDELFLAEMNRVCQWHLAGCSEYRRVWAKAKPAERLQDLPFLHVGVFKRRIWKTEAPGISHSRTLLSSTTSSSNPSRILLDERSSQLQAQSSMAILKDIVGDSLRPLAVLDDARSLRRRGEASARTAAAMSLTPLAAELGFLLDQCDDPRSVRWERLDSLLSNFQGLLVYGFTWMLWQAWKVGFIPATTREALKRTRVHFVHSGGWKKLEAARVSRQEFDEALLGTVGPGSKVVDFYGLVEQVGVVFPLCESGYRHVPRWAGVLVRDPWTLEPIEEGPGMLQFMNFLAWGSPYHSVLTEDTGRLTPGKCGCGRQGPRFELLGRVPSAELRGCANV